ncbi:MAG: sulfite exporter TauE/SafE family protein [Planctomycetaceae bacterium]|jgi:uncharacterized protein|nr:sulfite exporter TauE/SafE family protein [Planctomycetaceae bacterium]MBT6485294.1 sulfite exporter TauE/SafE family protein [Planctomycetaceae bacterium]MBT6496187.1 sulfite exporter TauE/SafE family protein [Planctomycetaceae bacterium]
MPADIPWFSICGAVFFAALIQSATGIGFGLIAMPFLLIALAGTQAVQITVILSLGMSVMLCIRTYRDCDVKALRTLMIGGAVGLPFGLTGFLFLDPIYLKLLAGAVVLLFAISIVWQPVVRATETKPSSPIFFGASILSGAMAVCLAMPGPAVIGPLREHCDSNRSVRSTIFAYFVLAYVAAFGLQMGFADISTETMWISLILVPAMVIGISAGHLLAPRLSPRQIKVSIVLVLLGTSASLIVSTVREVMF